MNDSLQSVQTITILNGSVKEITVSLMNIISNNGPITSFIMIFLFILLIISFYIFFERYFTLNKSAKENSSLLNDIQDCIHEGKIDSAIDLCKRDYSPESKILLKGVMRIGKPAREINDAIENTAKTELFKLEKNIDILNLIAKSAPVLGLLGSILAIIVFSFNSEPQSLSTGSQIYLALISTVTGLAVGLIAYLFYSLLKIRIKKCACYFQLTTNNFLDFLNKPII